MLIKFLYGSNTGSFDVDGVAEAWIAEGNETYSGLLQVTGLNNDYNTVFAGTKEQAKVALQLLTTITQYHLHAAHAFAALEKWNALGAGTTRKQEDEDRQLAEDNEYPMEPPYTVDPEMEDHPEVYKDN